jgi:flavin-dependent dehydrogenase
MSTTETLDALIIGASLSGAACAKRLVDAGLSVVALEKKALPRHKICSGILSPRGHRFLLENFGPLPREVLHEPTSCAGVAFHFPSGLSLPLDFHGGPTPHLHRKFSDHWAIQRSGVAVHEGTSFVSLHDHGDAVTVRAKRDGADITYRARYVIGADGPSSRVVRALYSDYPKRTPWFMVGQKFHRIRSCPLDPAYFHFWFHPALGHYTWSHARDGRQIVGVGFPVGGNVHHVHRRVASYLQARHGVELDPADEHEGCEENFGPSLINRYVFGKGNVLVTGQAAGFLNMMAEGMSCALHSGAIAGESVVEAIQRRRPAQEVYRTLIASEVQRCTDQWNPLKILFAQPHEADFLTPFRRMRFIDQVHMVRELLSFMTIYGRFNWGRQMLAQAWTRLMRGEYTTSRWL